MRALLLLITLFTVGFSQTPPKAVVPTTVKMPAARSAELKALQEQANRLEQAMKEVRLQASVLVNRAALEAHLTAEQLDAMDLVVDDKGNYEWRPKPAPSPTPKPEK